MGLFSIFDKPKEKQIGGIGISELDEIKSKYKPSPAYTKKSWNNVPRSTVTDILYHLENGLNVNYRPYDMYVPVFMMAANRDVYDIMVYFGADVELKKLKPNMIYSLLYLPFFLYDDYKEFILSLQLCVHINTDEMQKLEWLKSHNVEFNDMILAKRNNTNDYSIWATLLESNKADAFNFIINETNFDFNREIEYSNFYKMNGVAKVWFFYVIVCLYDISGMDDVKLNRRKVKLESFLNRCNGIFSVKDVNSLEQNIYFMLQKIPQMRSEIVQIFIDLDVNPFAKDHSGTSFYDLMKSNVAENLEVIEVLEKSKFFPKHMTKTDTSILKGNPSINIEIIDSTQNNEQAKNIDLAQVVNGKTTVVTGTVEGFTRKEYETYLKELGAIISSEVNGKTEVLIVGDNPGSKVDKAEKLGVKIIDLKKSSLSHPIKSEISSNEPAAGKVEQNYQKVSKQLNIHIIKAIFDKHRVFDEVDCESDIDALTQTRPELLVEGINKLLETIKNGLSADVVKSIKADIEKSAKGELETTEEHVHAQKGVEDIELHSHKDRTSSALVECPIAHSLSSQQKKIIKLISAGKDETVLKLLRIQSDWAFSFDRNVNLLHLALIFDCPIVAMYLIDQNINIHQATTDVLLGVKIFNQPILKNLTALEIANRIGEKYIAQQMETLM